MKILLITMFMLIVCTCGCQRSTDSPVAPVELASVKRLVVVLEDVTESYPFQHAARRKVLEIVDALGPGDEFLLIQISDTFRPEQNVRIQCQLPVVPMALLQPADNMVEWEENQKQLTSIWASVDHRKAAIADWLEKPVNKQKGGGTDVLGTLQYCAQRFEEAENSEKHMWIFSDLIHEVKKRKFTQPTSTWDPVRLSGVHINALFVPWLDSETFRRRETAWRKWLTEAFFKMYDPAASETQAVLPASKVVRRVSSPFDL